jgi:hypothetical protein
MKRQNFTLSKSEIKEGKWDSIVSEVWYSGFLWETRIQYTTTERIETYYFLRFPYWRVKCSDGTFSPYQIYYPKRRSGETRRPRRPQ